MKRCTFLLVGAIVVALIAAGLALAKSSKRVTAGKWSGQHLNLTVTATGFDFEFDCATGSAKGAPILDRHGKFKLYGNYVSQPGAASVPRESRPAEYSGCVMGKSMILEVRFTDTKQLVGNYQLSFGQHQRLNRCPVSRPPDRKPLRVEPVNPVQRVRR